MPYKLSATLAAHASDVRAVVSPSENLILSASRDHTAIAWQRPSSTAPFSKTSVLRAGSGFVNAVTYVPPSPDAPEGYVVAGGQDATINVFSLTNGQKEPRFCLVGHQQNVCALHTAADGTIISGSWDLTARVWKNFQHAFTLKGHQQSVWAVLALGSDMFLTGSADNTIKLWERHKDVRTYRGHKQAVRGLAIVPNIGFASCSNDGQILIWTMEGDIVHELSGHTSFVYSVSVLSNGDIVSGGEDRTVRIWRDGECIQTIVHPAISVWAVSVMPNDDIVTGCSDGVVRVFSASEERWAPADEIKTYEEELAKTALPAQQVGDIDKSKLPGPEALAQPGKKPGETKMIKNGELVEAHQWDSASRSWQKIGDVVDAVGSGRKQLYQGKEYDYVFDVDIQEGAPPLKLPYNASENPFSAAHRFLESHDLPMSYLDQVASFIEKNTAAVNISSGGEAEYSDPFTGSSRYRASQNTGTIAGSNFVDPFSESRYRPQDAATPGPQVIAPTPPTPARQVILPVRNTLSFIQANVSAMESKLYQFDESLKNEISTSSLGMYHEELGLIDEVFGYINAASKSRNEPGHPFSDKHIDVIIRLLERWPPSQRFPLIDIARLVIKYGAPFLTDPAIKARFLDALFNAAEWRESWSYPLPKPRETNTLLLLRALSNAFQDDTMLVDQAWVKLVLERLTQAQYAVLTKAQRVALGTVLFNLSCVGLHENVDPALVSMHGGLVVQVLQSEKEDSEAAYRALVALGNIVYAAKAKNSPLDKAQEGAVRQCLASVVGTFNEDRMRDMANAIQEML